MAINSLIDLGLTYEAAMHGVQSAIKAANPERNDVWKHLRVGIDSAHITDLALAELLISKGVFTRDEYVEAVRLAANAELDRHEKEWNAHSDTKIIFR